VTFAFFCFIAGDARKGAPAQVSWFMALWALIETARPRQPAARHGFVRYVRKCLDFIFSIMCLFQRYFSTESPRAPTSLTTLSSLGLCSPDPLPKRSKPRLGSEGESFPCVFSLVCYLNPFFDSCKSCTIVPPPALVGKRKRLGPGRLGK